MNNNVSNRLQWFVFNIVPARKALGRALLAVLRRIRSERRLRGTIDRLPTSIASHPAIVSLRNAKLMKETSSGRDLIIFCGNTVHTWTPAMVKTKGKGFIGGAEEAVINLSGELAKLGWNITVYNNCGNETIRNIVPYHDPSGVKAHRIVTYRPFWELNFRDKQDVVILWRSPRALDTPINASRIFVDLHDGVLSAEEFTAARIDRLNKVLVKSQFHRSLYENVPDSKIAVIPNGIDLSLLESNPPIKKDPYLIINTSSADRSMDVLPKLFKEVKRRVPQARLQWAYGWEVYRACIGGDKKKLQWMKRTQKDINEAGIESLGRLTQAEVGKLYQRAAILAYPTECLEIDCISVKKAQAAGCLPIVTDLGALAESAPFGWKVHSTKTKDTWNRPGQLCFGLEDEYSQQEWIDLCVKALQCGPPDGVEMKNWSRQFEWRKVAAKWNAILTM